MVSISPIKDPQSFATEQQSRSLSALPTGLPALIAEALLEGFEEPCFLLDRTARIVCCNRGGLQLLGASAGLVSRDGRMHAGSAEATDILVEAVELVTARGRCGRHTHRLKLQRPDGAGAVSLLLLRWTPESERVEAACRHVLAIVRPVWRPGIDAMEQFGFTKAEAGVALHLVEGLSPRAIAERQGRSLSTIRTHLAHLMVKTHTNRQSDLVLALTQGPDGRGW